jgi:FMN-dependent NADH-azoreductase
MPTLLRIDASPRGDYSISRRLTSAFVDAWKAKNPDGKVITRDLTKSNLTFVDLDWIAGAYSAPEQHTPEHKKALAISDELVAELLSADEIVLGTPMYNFAVPAATKAWIDHVVRFGKTFTAGPEGYKGLATGRKATLIVASGGSYEPGTPAEGYNQETPYLKNIFGFIGITDVSIILAGGTNPVTQGQLSSEEFLAPLLPKVEAAA